MVTIETLLNACESAIRDGRTEDALWRIQLIRKDVQLMVADSSWKSVEKNPPAETQTCVGLWYEPTIGALHREVVVWLSSKKCFAWETDNGEGRQPDYWI